MFTQNKNLKRNIHENAAYFFENFHGIWEPNQKSVTKSTGILTSGFFTRSGRRRFQSYTIDKYRVMQSDRNSFGGDVVSDSFNMTFQVEDNNLDQMHESKYVRIISVMILILYNIIWKFILKQQ